MLWWFEYKLTEICKISVPHNSYSIKMWEKVLDGENFLEDKVFAKATIFCRCPG